MAKKEETKATKAKGQSPALKAKYDAHKKRKAEAAVRKEAADKKLKGDFKFHDRDIVQVKGTDEGKFKISSKDSFDLVGHSAKQLISKGAAKFVKVVKEYVEPKK